MALGVFLQEKPERLIHGVEYEHILDFDEDGEGYYWFLYPLFLQLNKSTGQMIDLYGYAFFNGDNFHSLANTIVSARQLAKNQPDEWDVVVGFEVGSSRREIREPVSKAKMLSLLDKIEEAIKKAISKNYYVNFWGD